MTAHLPPKAGRTQNAIHLVERVFEIPVQRQLKQEFGFRTVEAGARSTFKRADFSGESMMLTGDLHVAVVRQAIETRAEELLRGLTQQYEMGITIEQVVLQDVNPPDPVKPSWDEVNQAQQQRDRLINEGRGECNKVIHRAKEILDRARRNDHVSSSAQMADARAEWPAAEPALRRTGEGRVAGPEIARRNGRASWAWWRRGADVGGVVAEGRAHETSSARAGFDE